MVDQALLAEPIKSHLAPALRHVGFVGSGKQFRRAAGDCLHVVELQLRSGGGSFAVNLGLHPLDIPDVRGNAANPKKITVDLCEFRQRLAITGADQWWVFSNPQDAIAAVTDCAATYLDIGEHKFAAQTGPTSALRTTTPEQFAGKVFDFSGFASTYVRMGRALALMRRSTGEFEDSRRFAAIALDNIGTASGLTRELEALAH